MGDESGGNDGPLWADGDMMFRVSGAGAEPDRLVKPARGPFAVIGRSGDADVVLDDRSVSSRHAYLHLDDRGVYAVDLVTRTGTRINGTSRNVGWLRPGDWLDVAGRRIELLRVRLGGEAVDPPPCDTDMLADTGLDALAGVTLEPRRSDDPPWVLGSELVFLGWSASCGIQVKDTSVARTHCALVRTSRGAYLVDLCGRQTWVEDRPVVGAVALRDGDLITLGSTQFTARINRPAGPTPDSLPQVFSRDTGPTRATLLTRLEESTAQPPAAFFQGRLPIDPGLVPAEAQTALLAWMMGTIQGGQGEILRRQGEFQVAMTEALRKIQLDNANLLNAILQRIEGNDREMAALRSELGRRNAPPQPPAPPDVTPLRVARPDPNPDPTPPDSKASTAWLLQRVHQLEDDNRSAWKDLLGRLTQSRRDL